MRKIIGMVLAVGLLAWLGVKFIASSPPLQVTSMASSEGTPSAQRRDVATETDPPPSEAPRAKKTAVGSVTSSDSSTETNESAALARLQSESARTWTLRRDGLSGRARTLAQGAWSGHSAASARDSADAFVKNYVQDIFGVAPDRLRFDAESITDRTRIVYTQIVDGVEVYGGTLSLFFEDGVLTRVQSDLVALDAHAPPTGSSFQDAFARYRSSTADNTILKSQPRTVLFPADHALVYAYDFYVSEAKTTYRVLYDIEARRVIKKWTTHIE